MPEPDAQVAGAGPLVGDEIGGNEAHCRGGYRVAKQKGIHQKCWEEAKQQQLRTISGTSSNSAHLPLAFETRWDDAMLQSLPVLPVGLGTPGLDGPPICNTTSSMT